MDHMRQGCQLAYTAYVYTALQTVTVKRSMTVGLHDGDALRVYAAHVAVFKHPNLHETHNRHELRNILQQVSKLHALLSHLLQNSSCRVCIHLPAESALHLMHSILYCVEAHVKFSPIPWYVGMCCILCYCCCWK